MFTLSSNPARPPLFNFVDSKDSALTQARLLEKKKNLISLKIIKKMDMTRINKANSIVKSLNYNIKAAPMSSENSIIQNQPPNYDNIHPMSNTEKMEIKKMRDLIEKVIKQNKRYSPLQKKKNKKKVLHLSKHSTLHQNYLHNAQLMSPTQMEHVKHIYSDV